MEANSGAKLTLIKGGVPDKEQAQKVFVSAFATDTRLMGEIAMGIHWQLPDHPDATDLFQFFSFDATEFGLDNYSSVWGNDQPAIDAIRQTLVGPLGGRDIDITEEQARLLFNRHYKMAKASGGGLPKGAPEYEFLVDKKEADDAAMADITKKLCTRVTCNEELINYFLMRLFAADHEGVDLLTEKDAIIDIMPSLPSSLLCKNTITQKEGYFVTHALIEAGNTHRIIASEIRVNSGKIVSHKIISSMDVSPQEAAMMLTRPEYVTVYQPLTESGELANIPIEFEHNAIVTDHDNGRLFMVFHENNDHVKKRTYRLSDDVLGLFFVAASGEVVVAAYTKEAIVKMEQRVIQSPLGYLMIPVAKYEFKDPVLYEFAGSEYDDFVEFVELITDE